MPLIVTTLWGWICKSTRAFSNAARTPKSPHPGHQSGSTLPLTSGRVTCFKMGAWVAMSAPSDHDFVHRDRQRCPPRYLFLHSFNDVMRHEWFAVVFPDVAI